MQGPTNQNQQLRSGLVLYPSQQQAIEKILTELARQISSQFILLADVSGQIISTRGGEQNNIDLIGLGALVVSDLAASHEIARLTRQYQADQMVFREGQSIHTLTCEAGYHLALMVQISTDTPLGWARMIIRKIARDLGDIANTPPPDEDQFLGSSSEFNVQEDGLADLFNDALDDLWLE